MSEITERVAQLEATEKQIQERQAALAASATAVEEKEKQKAALDAELARVQGDIVKAKEERRQKDSSFQDKVRNENLETAKQKFLAEFKYEKPEDQAKFLEAFKAYDTGAVSPDLIYKDMVKAHVASNPERYIELERTAERLRASGVDFTVSSAGSAFQGSGQLPPNDSAGLSTDDIRAAQWANIPFETYRRLKAEGKLD
jgi:DNA repair exonuclease SbcCD ATPase subunit